MTQPGQELLSTSNSIARRVDHLAERIVDGDLVLYDPARQYVHALNPTAAFIWRMCDGSRDKVAIVEELASRYPDYRGVIEEDVSTLMETFRAAGLLVQ